LTTWWAFNRNAFLIIVARVLDLPRSLSARGEHPSGRGIVRALAGRGGVRWWCFTRRWSCSTTTPVSGMGPRT
jgi:hypothetical protein